MNNLLFDEKELLKQVSEGNQQAYRQLYDKYHQRIYSLCLFISHSSTTAEELTQEVFVKLWEERNKLNAVTYFDRWIGILTRNHIFNYLRRQARQRAVFEKLEKETCPLATSVEEEVDGHALEQRLHLAVQQLPFQQKKVYQFSRNEGLKTAEIAHAMGLQENTVKNHLKAALYKIRSQVTRELH